MAINKIDGSRECIAYHYWYFFITNFRLQSKVCGVYHDMRQKPISFDNVAIFTVGENVFRTWIKVTLWIEWKILIWGKIVDNFDYQKMYILSWSKIILHRDYNWLQKLSSRNRETSKKHLNSTIENKKESK